MSEDALSVAPAAPQTDVLQEQHDTPRPLETKPQAEEPKPEKAEKLTREDAVKQAIDKATKEPEKPKDEAKEPPKDKKAEPEPEKPEAKGERGPDGKFAPKQADPEAEPQAEQPKRPTAYRDPPQRFDDAAKAEWEAVPESVRGTVHRMVKETEQGIQKYRADAEAYEPVRQYDEMARRNGGSLKQTLDQVAELEQVFSRNPIEGFHRIAQRLGINVHQVAQQIAAQNPQQIADQQLRMQMADQQRQTQALQQQLEQERQARAEQERTTQAMTEWQQFQQAHPDAVQLEPAMVDFLRKYPAGDDVPMRDRLADAYAFALAKTKGAHTAEEDPALAQTQVQRTPNPAGQRSIAGSARGDAPSSKQKLSRQDATRKAMRQFGL